MKNQEKIRKILQRQKLSLRQKMTKKMGAGHLLLCPKAHDFGTRETFMGRPMWRTYGTDKVLCPAGKEGIPGNLGNLRKTNDISD